MGSSSSAWGYLQSDSASHSFVSRLSTGWSICIDHFSYLIKTLFSVCQYLLLLFFTSLWHVKDGWSTVVLKVDVLNWMEWYLGGVKYRIPYDAITYLTLKLSYLIKTLFSVRQWRSLVGEDEPAFVLERTRRWRPKQDRVSERSVSGMWNIDEQYPNMKNDPSKIG